MSHAEKRVQFCELYSKKVFNSVNEIQKNQFLESYLKKRLGSLSHISKRRFNSLSRIRKKVQFCESYY